jgi:ferric-dicitrate binding protein FerR (iron transport regulator)
MANSNARKKLIRLIQKYLADKASPEEEQFLEAYYNCFDKEVTKQETMEEEEKEALSGEMKAAIWQQIENTQQQAPVVPWVKRSWFRVTVAAVTIAVVCLPVYYLITHTAERKPVAKTVVRSVPVHDALPGGNKAMLTLNDGSIIVLDSVQNGMLHEQGNVKVMKQEGQLKYQSVPQGGSNGQLASVAYNTLSTPRGGQYQLVLPDGSKVWLNAASSIRFPTAFAGNEREVELTGEAYFEITTLRLSSGEKMPFRVVIAPSSSGESRGEVEVLGTHFNVNAYNDEEFIRTTLLEGKVKVTSGAARRDQPAVNNKQSAILAPGQQAVITSSKGGAIKTINDADTEGAVAWKNGLFYFDDVNIEAIMRQLSRWYQVQVVYKGKIPDRRFAGQVSRNANLSQVLKILELSKVHFTIEGETVTVMP